MNKIFNLTSTFKALPSEDGSVFIRGMASTVDIDRAGDVIASEAWQKGGLDNFLKNPIILFNHDYDRPIGRATKLMVTENGLEMEAKISKSAPANVCELVKEGILGAFSVGFRVKDADYITETDGLRIKDAELFEVSVVSVPCNQTATFSLAKSFNSMEEYEEFKKTFTNRVDLAGQPLAKDEDKSSSVASDTPDVVAMTTKKEIKMSEEVKTPEIDLEAFAKKVAEETAAKIAMKQAEQRAAEKKAQEEEAAKAVAATKQEEAVRIAVESGAERLMKDVEAKLAEKDAKIEEILAQYNKDLAEKNEEITKMRDSKRVFADRATGKQDLTPWQKDFMYAHILGVMTGKGWNTDFARQTFEKAGIEYDYTGNGASPGIEQGVRTAIEKEVQLNLRLATLFREIPVNSAATVLPIQPDSGFAAWQTGAAASGNLEDRAGGAANTFQPKQKILSAYRLISQTYMDNHIDEEVLVNLMPMLTDSVARAHARAVDDAILGAGGSGAAFSGLNTYAVSASTLIGSGTGQSAALTAALLMEARSGMGKYGIDPRDVVYVVSQNRYYDLIADPEFSDISEVGSDMAAKLTGAIGSVYGSPVVISDNFPAEGTGVSAAFAVNVRNYVIPRLRGVTVEQDYEVGNQRRVIVATQSLGFEELVGGVTGNEPVVSVDVA